MAHFKSQYLLDCKANIAVGGIHQILLNGNSTRLLIVNESFTESSGQIWSVETGVMVYSGALEKARARIWMNHPLQRELLLAVGPRDLKLIQ